MPNVVEVVEKEVSLPYLVSSFEMNVYILTLGVSAVVTTNTYDKDGRQLYNKQFIIEGSDYDAWGTDDSYIKDLIASKLGLEPIPLGVGRGSETESVAMCETAELLFDELP